MSHRCPIDVSCMSHVCLIDQFHDLYGFNGFHEFYGFDEFCNLKSTLTKWQNLWIYGFYDVATMTKMTKFVISVTKVIKSGDKICGFYEIKWQKSQILRGLWILWTQIHKSYAQILWLLTKVTKSTKSTISFVTFVGTILWGDRQIGHHVARIN